MTYMGLFLCIVAPLSRILRPDLNVFRDIAEWLPEDHVSHQAGANARCADGVYPQFRVGISAVGVVDPCHSFGDIKADLCHLNRHDVPVVAVCRGDESICLIDVSLAKRVFVNAVSRSPCSPGPWCCRPRLGPGLAEQDDQDRRQLPARRRGRPDRALGGRAAADGPRPDGGGREPRRLGSNIGGDAVAKSAPDGYTLLMSFGRHGVGQPAHLREVPSTRPRIWGRWPRRRACWSSWWCAPKARPRTSRPSSPT